MYYIVSFFPGGIPDISFDPMKVVTDTVEEFADRRDMFLAYLSNMLMEDKGVHHINYITNACLCINIQLFFNYPCHSLFQMTHLKW